MRFLPVLLLISLSACIILEDAGPEWAKATPDPCLSKLAGEFHKASFERIPADAQMDSLTRAITLDGHHYLMIKASPEDASAHLYRFIVQNGVLIAYRPNPTKREAFLAAYPDTDLTIKSDLVKIPALTGNDRTILAEVAGDERYWEVDRKILYNPLLKDECRFEDRDLDAIGVKGNGEVAK